MSRAKMVKRLSMKYLAAIVLLAAAATAQTYTTHFPLTENPISEGGKWINAGVVGLDWTNVRTTPGFAFGTQPGTAGSPGFADSWALLSGAWGPDQTAQATINDPSPNDNCHQENELVLRGNLSAHSATGYEVTVKAADDASSYLIIVRWNGAYGDFTYLANLQGSAYAVKTGDVFKATIVGNVITAYINGVQKARVTDYWYATGHPGMGFYLGHYNSTICAGTNAGYGFSNYTAVASSSPPFVQGNSGPSTIQASNSSLAVSYLNPQTAGNLNIVAVGWGDNTSSISSVTDSKGNTYTWAVGPTSTTDLQQSIYYAKNIVGGTSNKVTVKFNQAAAYPDVRILEYSGLDPTSPLDVTAAAAGNGPSASSGFATTTSANELIFGAGNSAHHFTAGGTGFYSRMINIFGNIAEDKTVTSSGSYDATTTNITGLWVMQMATFRSPNPPTVIAISPASGSANGGTAVTITGTGFLSGASVKLGTAAATGVTVVSSTSITATTPAHVAGTVNVVVTNSNGQSGSLANGYSYTVTTGGTIGYVQGKSTTQGSGSSVAIAYPAGQTGGDLNVVAVMWGDTISAVSSVTDSKGNTYALAMGPTKVTGLTSAIYYAKNIASGSNTITVKFNQTASYPNVNVLEYSGLDTANPLDVRAAATGSGTTANSGSATTTSASELIVGAGNPTSVFTSAGSGFTSRIINAFGGISEDKIVSSAGSYNATATLTSGIWVMQMVTFRASSP
jgi:IPT/TIG domain-containing protein